MALDFEELEGVSAAFQAELAGVVEITEEDHAENKDAWASFAWLVLDAIELSRANGKPVGTRQVSPRDWRFFRAGWHAARDA